MNRFVFILFTLFVTFPVTVYAGNPPHQPSSSYVTPSSSAPADGNTKQTVSVHLLDSSGVAISGDTVSLTSSNDTTAAFPQNNQVTDSSGNATFTVTSTTPGTTQLTLTDTTNAATFTNWFSVIFTTVTTATPTPTPLSCSTAPAAPHLVSVISKTNYKVTVTWVDSADPVTNYGVSYGTESGKYTSNIANAGAQGTTSYTIDGLTGNKKYYLVVTAANTCGTSGKSNEIAVISQPIPSTPIPTTSSASVFVTPAPTIPSYATTSPKPTVTETPTASDQPTASSRDDVYINIAMGVLFAGVCILGYLGIKKLRTRRRN